MNRLSDTDAVRQAVIDACLWMQAQGLNTGTAGNVSVRVEDGVLITPSGIAYEALRPEMLVRLPNEGTPEAGDLRPSSEWRFHQRLLQERPDMAVVVHAHPPYCTALAVQRRAIPACHYMVTAFGGSDVPLAGYALFGSDALSDEVARALKDRHGCLMANHGATVLGETLERALWRMGELEALAQTFLLSQIGGVPHILSEAEITDAKAAFESYGPKKS